MPLTILVADDDLGTRISVSDYLELLGYSVIVAKDGKQALSMIDKYQPHALITDINMPRMDGYELVRQVRQKPAFRALPVVFLSERNTVEERIRGYKTGCDLYLPKPFEIQELVTVIRSLLERALNRPPGNDPSIQDEQEFVADTELDEINKQNAIAHHPLNFNLTEREQEVLNLLATAITNVEIGKKLNLSDRTIEKYVSNLLRKTQTSNRTELTRFALENHLVEIKTRKNQK